MPKNILNGNFSVDDGDIPSAAEWNRLGIFGDGSDGSYTSGDNLTPGVVYNFTDFVLESGDTITSTVSNSDEPIVVKVKGDVDISGTVNLEGNGFAASNGYNPIILIDNDNNILNSGTGGQAGDSTGQGGIGARKIQSKSFFKTYSGQLNTPVGTGGSEGGRVSSTSPAGGGGGGAGFSSSGQDGEFAGGGGGNQGGDGGAGGAGGGSIIIICRGDLSLTGTLNVSGEDGGDGDDGEQGAGGGGGGGGGSAWLISKGIINNSGTKQAGGGSGGQGGNGSDNDGGNGGNGGAGQIVIERV